jgi:hypothetical protein
MITRQIQTEHKAITKSLMDKQGEIDTFFLLKICTIKNERIK